MTTPTAEGIALHRRIVAIAARIAPDVATAYAAETDPTAAADAARDALDDAASSSVRAECRRVRGDLTQLAQRSPIGRLSALMVVVWSGATARDLAALDALDAEIAG